MKKIKIFLLSLILGGSLALASNAFASIDFIDGNSAPGGPGIVQFTCSSGDYYTVFTMGDPYATYLEAKTACSGTVNWATNYEAGTQVIIVECDSAVSANGCNSMTLEQAEASNEFNVQTNLVDERGFTFTGGGNSIDISPSQGNGNDISFNCHLDNVANKMELGTVNQETDEFTSQVSSDGCLSGTGTINLYPDPGPGGNMDIEARVSTQDGDLVEDFGIVYTFHVSPGMNDLMASASGAFQTTTGFPLAGAGSVTEFAGDGLIKPFMGSGLAVLYYLRWWIIAIAVISAVVYFAYRAIGTVTVTSRKGRKK
jgi:hypothetical protein